ncbi:MAG: hypothetical protein R3C17_12330 [Planctomycetaceae bacterium]
MLSPRRNWLNGLFSKKPNRRDRFSRTASHRESSEQLEVRTLLSAVYHSLATADFSQDWTDIGLITTNNDWSGVPSIQGYRGDNLTAVTGADPQTILSDDTPGVLSVLANQPAATSTTGAVGEFELANPVVAMQGSGTADAPYLQLYLDTTGRNNINVSYLVRDIDGSADDAVQQVALQYRVGTTGAFINIPEAFVTDATTGGTATQTTSVSVTLPLAAENQSQLQLRILTANAVGNDEWVGIDDIVVTSEGGAPTPAILIAQSGGATKVTEGVSTDSFTVALNQAPGADVTVTLTPASNRVDLGNGPGNPLDLTFTSATGTVPQTVTVTPIDDLIVQGDQIVGISVSTVSSDTGFNGLSAADIAVSVLDNDFTGLIPPQTNNFSANAGQAGLGIGWTVYSVDADSANSWTAFDDAGNRVAQANAFGGNAPANDWLISTPFNLDTTTGEVVSFVTRTAFADAGVTAPEVRFRYSTDYSGIGDPTAATWTELPYAFPAENSAIYMPSGNIDISGISGSLVWFAFQYTSSGNGAANSTQWRVDDFSVQPGTVAPDFSVAAINASQAEGNAGNTAFTFTVTRSGNTVGPDSVTYSVTGAAVDGADASDFEGGVFPTNIVVDFADGEGSKVITVNVAGDAVQEANEGFVVTLSNPSRSGTLSTAAADGTILDDDAPAPTVWINEILFNPPATDAPNEYIEIRGTAGYVIPSGVYLVGIEGDTTGAGDVQTMFNLSGLTLGSNGYLVLLQSGNTYSVDSASATVSGTGSGFGGLPGFSADSGGTDIENSSVTFLLIQTAVAPTLTDDIDSDNNGVADGAIFAGWSVLDGISVIDNAADAAFTNVVYSTAATFVGSTGKDIVATTATANYVARVGTSTGDTAADWFGGGLEGTAPNWNLIAGDAFPASYDGQALNHIGSQNPVAIVNQAPVFTSGTTFSVDEANTLGVTGPSSSATPYLTSTNPNVQFTSILTVGDAINGYRMVGIPDGLGAFDNGDGTFTLLMNQELVNTAGVTRAHGATGAFVSRWIIRKSDFAVLSGSDLMQSVIDGGTGVALTGAALAFSRFCSADLPAVSAFFNAATGLGTEERIFLNGEENGNGRALAHIVTGSAAGTSYTIPLLSSVGGSWENLLANPATGDLTLVAANSDAGGGKIYFYLGTKQSAGTEVQKAGLTNGTLYQLAVTGVTSESRTNAFGTVSPSYSGSFTLTTGTGTGFLRPEDGAWDPANPNDYYFVTTDQLDTVQDGNGGQVGRSRLYRAHFNDLANPTAGGTIEALIDGTEGANMFDNITIANGVVTLQEDVGNAPHNGKVWQYNIAGDTLIQIAQHDRARFGDVGLAATSPFTQDEESSGVVDVSAIFGPDTYLLVVQAHYNIGDPELVEGGQLLFMRTNVTTGSQLVTTVTAVDAESDALTYLISGGADASQFEIDPVSGRLSFKLAPNSETPADTDTDNVYFVEVSVSDGVNSPVVQLIEVTVSGVNESPENTTVESVSIPENTTAVTIATGTDPEGVPLTFAISGGADAAKFDIDSTSGVLTFVNAPDFESPTDNGANNSYFVTVTVSDGVNAPVNKTVVVTVTDVPEWTFNAGLLTVLGTPSNDYIRVMSFAGTVRLSFNGSAIDTLVPLASLTAVSVSGLGGNDILRLESSLGASVTGTLVGGEGNDTLVGGLGDDTLDGGAGNDSLTGGGGDDSLNGGADKDKYVFNTNTPLGSDTVIDTSGIDQLYFVGSTDALIVDLSLTTAQTVNVNLTLTLDSGSSIENIFGGSGDDILIGNSLNNVLNGNAGNDVLSGGDGNDILYGGTEKNILIGGNGVDILTGGNSADLLLGAWYSLESDVVALAALRSEWISGNPISVQVDHLLGNVPDGANGSFTLTSVTVKEDNAKDSLRGSSGIDWYLRNSVGATVATRDAVLDADLDSIFTEISSWL